MTSEEEERKRLIKRLLDSEAETRPEPPVEPTNSANNNDKPVDPASTTRAQAPKINPTYPQYDIPLDKDNMPLPRRVNEVDMASPMIKDNFGDILPRFSAAINDAVEVLQMSYDIDNEELIKEMNIPSWALGDRGYANRIKKDKALQACQYCRDGDKLAIVRRITLIALAVGLACFLLS